jgi:hypothetical protein
MTTPTTTSGLEVQIAMHMENAIRQGSSSNSMRSWPRDNETSLLIRKETTGQNFYTNFSSKLPSTRDKWQLLIRNTLSFFREKKKEIPFHFPTH